MPTLEELQAKLDAAQNDFDFGLEIMQQAEADMKSAMQGALDVDYDVSLCRCSHPVVCIPDGLPLCRACAEKEKAER